MRRDGRSAFAFLGVLLLALVTGACAASDAGITTKVKARLETDRNVNASHVQVATQNKVVTLSGPVESPAAKERAVTVARGVEGVVDVVDNLTVSTAVAAMPPPGAEAAAGTLATNGAPDDAAITQAVKEKLLKQPETSAELIDVETQQGVVTLSGQVKTPEEKEQVIQTARNTEGVQRVEDRLTVSTS